MDNIPDAIRALTPDEDMNTVVLKGTVAAPPDLRTFPSGAVKLHILVTVRSFEPRRRTDVIPVDFWDPSQEAIDTVHHHDRVWVAGYLRRHFYPQNDGRASRIECIARHVEVDRDHSGFDSDRQEQDAEASTPVGT